MPKPMTASGSTSGQLGYLVQTAQQYIEQHSSITEQQLNQGGYQIYTTFDKNQVAELSSSVAKMRKQHLDPKQPAGGPQRTGRGLLRRPGHRGDRRPVRR